MQEGGSVASESDSGFLTPTLGDLAGIFSRIARQSAVMLAVAFTALTAAYVVFDAVVPVESQLRLQSIISIVGIIVSYVLTRHLLATSAAPGTAAPASRVGAYIGLGIVTGLAIIVGFLLLVVPGLILAARWMLATPILLAEDTTVGEAMSRSWNVTADHWGKLIVAQLLVAAPLLVSMGVAFAAGMADTIELVANIAQNALLSLFSVASVVLSVAAYRAIIPDTGTLADVFA